MQDLASQIVVHSIAVTSVQPKLSTVVLEEPVQKVLADPLKAELQEITVAGKVEVYKSKPLLVVKDPAQIQSIITEKAGVKN